ncbi:hypothetical protein M0R89_04395 [Halorussus limi]|uniref:Uncharacterized protein n=1 Tax=Halorussus limi TaxID=2938695 RepID=A0A8U0HWV3_9EURY|nr:hypothetical protein [Halorussus limi]UPV75309.1 hypothetical protein M0R89_04395 [Halorussus limi]
MPAPVLYLARPRKEVSESLVRREFAWLIKNQLYDTNQLGWSFSHGQVNRYPVSGRDSMLSNLSKGNIGDVETVINCFRKENPCFIVPLGEEINIEIVAQRAATIEAVGEISDITNPDVRYCDNVGAFWDEQATTAPDVFQDAPPERRGVFNISHPFEHGPFLDGDSNDRYEIHRDGWQTMDPSGPIYSIYFPINADSNTSVDSSFKKIWSLCSRLPTGSNMSVESHTRLKPTYEVTQGPKYSISGNTLTFNSGAVSPGSLVLAIEDSIQESEINELLRRCSTLGLSIATEHSSGSSIYFLLKLHPLHKDNPKPHYKASRERRKLAQTEWARDEVPGYKKISTFESGPREHCLITVNSRQVVVKRTSGEGGRGKDSDDFMWAIGNEEPELFSVFRDTQRALACEESGRAFLDAIYDIWEATWEIDKLPSQLQRLHDELPPNSNAQDMEYGRLALLWIYALQFIVEDINYRFNFHPVKLAQNRIKYRKQGRDQPMNIVLRIAASNPSEDRLRKLTDQTKGQSNDVSRPSVAWGFEHLVPWLRKKNIITSSRKEEPKIPDQHKPSSLSDFL